MHTNHISIRQIQERQEESEQLSSEDISNRPQNPFSLDELKMYWRQFAYNIKQQGLQGADSMNLAMTKRDPKMPTATHIHQEFDNQVQIDLMNSNFSTQLLEFLRHKLQNWAVTIEFSIAENQEDNIKHLTGRDRFEILSRKNTNLLTLQKTFNLDIEY